MRIAVVSDIHGNRTAFEAVLADLRRMSPDVILHGGDLADGGSSPVEIVDRIRDLGCQGVVGNTDEMLFRPASLEEFAAQSPAMQPLVGHIREMAAWTRAALGEDRLAWLQSQPRLQIAETTALLHASPASLWHAPGFAAPDAELESMYEPLGQPVVAYGHIHQPYIRRLGSITVANSGSVSLSYDGDRRTAYLLIDNSEPQIRRLEYDVDREIQALSASGLPHANWTAKMLASGGFRMP